MKSGVMTYRELKDLEKAEHACISFDWWRLNIYGDHVEKFFEFESLNKLADFLIH